MVKAGSVFLLGWTVLITGCVSDPMKPDSSVREAAVELKAIEFLQREVPAWSRENRCFSCHNNGDAARALYAAMRAGHRISSRALADTTTWLAQPKQWEHNKGDPGFSDQRLANIQFAAALLAAHEAGHTKNRAALQEAARKVAADQDADGAWHIERQNPVGSPATYGTTLATFMAWQTLTRVEAPGTTQAITNAEHWLSAAPLNNVPNAAVLLSLAARLRREADHHRLNQSLDFLRLAQTADGGWGPYKDSPPEPFDTALALLALAEIRDRTGVTEMISRGRSFLLSMQRADGSWPATTRPAGGNSYAQQMSTTAWATLALLRTGEH
jgi:hypothetical protein